MASKALAMGITKAALTTTEDDYLLAMSNSFAVSFTSRGGAIVLDEKIDKDFVDFSTLITQLKSKAPEAVFMNVGIPQLSVAYRRMHELGLKKQFFSSYWVFKKDVLDAAGAQAPDGVIAVEMDFRKPRFVAAIKEEFQHEPFSSMTYSCYLGTAYLLQAIAKNTSIRTPQEMYTELLNIDTVQLLDDPVVFKDRELQVELQYEVMRSGRVEVFN